MANTGMDAAQAYDQRVAQEKAARAAGRLPQAGAPTGQVGTGGRVYAGDQHSFTDYIDPNALDRDLATRDKYNAQAESRMFGYLGGAGGAGGPAISRTGGDIAAREQAGRAAAFARAKDQAAMTAQSALSGLRNVMDRRGFSAGGGFADMKTAEALRPAADQVNDFTREQYIQDVNNLQHTGDLDYQGQIQQRGQNMAQLPALLGLVRSGRIY